MFLMWENAVHTLKCRNEFINQNQEYLYLHINQSCVLQVLKIVKEKHYKLCHSDVLRVLVHTFLGKLNHYHMCWVTSSPNKILTNARTELTSPQRIWKKATVIIPSLENCIKGQTGRTQSVLFIWEKMEWFLASVLYVYLKRTFLMEGSFI